MTPSLFFLAAIIFLMNIIKQSQASLHCQQRQCGNITVPNPFAIGKGCGINPDFELICEHVDRMRSILRLAQYPETEVIEISISPRNLKVIRNVSIICQDDNKEIKLFDSSVFYFSPTKNKFIAIGCDFSVSILQSDNHGLLHGCASHCPDESSSFNSQCTGKGCCQTSLPEGVSKSYSWRINMLNTGRQASVKSQCSYGVIAAEKFNDFGKLREVDSDYQRLPAEFEWVVKNITCKEAEKNQTTYACKDENSECIDSPMGYYCACLEDYEGTPFELGGCREINTCRDKDKNPCVEGSTCLKRYDGLYWCHCPLFYVGDGRKLGSGCHFGAYHIILIGHFFEEKVGRYITFKNNFSGTFLFFPPYVFFNTEVVHGDVLLVVIVAIGLYFYISYLITNKKKKEAITLKEYNYKKNGGLLLEERLRQAGANCTNFTIEEIRKFTDDFNDKRVIGNGGSGTVFKGILADGEDVAVKKSQEVGERHINDFINEIVILAQLRERKIVRLIGYCLDYQCPILVYEYVSNGPLSKHIHEDDLPPLSWMERISIAAEVASALAYLHYGVSATVIHRDIKPENILLTERNNAKLGDFGLSRAIPNGQTHGITAQQCGTTGYVDPNMIDDFREEHDVYGYGMVLVELLTKRFAYTLHLEFRATFAQKPLSDILDTRLSHTRLEEQPLRRMVDLAARCIELLGERPNMKEVAAEMSRIEREMRRVIINNNEADSLSTTTSLQ